MENIINTFQNEIKFEDNGVTYTVIIKNEVFFIGTAKANGFRMTLNTGGYAVMEGSVSKDGTLIDEVETKLREAKEDPIAFVNQIEELLTEKDEEDAKTTSN